MKKKRKIFVAVSSILVATALWYGYVHFFRVEIKEIKGKESSYYIDERGQKQYVVSDNKEPFFHRLVFTNGGPSLQEINCTLILRFEDASEITTKHYWGEWERGSEKTIEVGPYNPPTQLEEYKIKLKGKNGRFCAKSWAINYSMWRYYRSITDPPYPN